MRARRHRAAFAVSILLLVAAEAGAGEPRFLESETDIGRVFRTGTRSFTLEAQAEPGREYAVEAAHPMLDSGGRAVGVFVRLPGRTVRAGEDGRLMLRCEIATLATASTGRISAIITIESAGARASATVRFEVLRGALIAPDEMDLGDVFIKGGARGEMPLELHGTQALSAWVEWTALDGRHSQILPAFVKFDSREVELPPGREVRLPVAVELPGGTRPGEYAGLIRLRAGPYRSDVRLRLNAAHPRILPVRESVDFGTVGLGLEAATSIDIAMEGAGFERFEAELAGPLRKRLREQAVLEGVSVTADANSIEPGRAVRVHLQARVPAGQEDGEYEGELVLRVGPSRARVPVRIAVPRAPGVPMFEVSPLERSVDCPRGEVARGAVSVSSNSDELLVIVARLTPPKNLRWAAEFGEDESSPEEATLLVSARGRAEVELLMRSPDDARLGEREVAVVELTDEKTGEGVLSEFTLVAARPKDEAPASAGPGGAARVALVIASILSAGISAIGWRTLPLRYGAASTSLHALVLAFGFSAPFAAGKATGGAPERLISVHVLQLPEDFGSSPEDLEYSEKLARMVAAETSDAGSDAEAGSVAGVAAVQGGPAEQAQEANPARQADREAEGAPPSGAAVPLPTDPDANPRTESRETVQVARARPAAPRTVEERVSDGFTFEDAPVARVSLLERGELKRATVSSPVELGAASLERVESVVERGPALLAEVIPPGAMAVADAIPPPESATPGRASGISVADRFDREAASLERRPLERTLRGVDLAAARGRPETPKASASSIRPERLGPAEALPQMTRDEAPQSPATETAPRQIARAGASSSSDRRESPAPPPFERRTAPPPVSRIEIVRQPGAVSSQATPERIQIECVANLAEVLPSPAVAPARAELVDETGQQAVTRARGESVAGDPGRVEQSYSPPISRRTELEEGPSGLERVGAGSAAASIERPSRGAAVSGRVRAVSAGVVFGTLRHAGEWNVSPRAMTALSRELPARQPGFDLQARAMPVKAGEEAMEECAFVYMTGRADPGLSDHERSRLARYLERGGFLWVEDGASPGDDTFDRAVRRMLGSLLEGGSFRRAAFTESVFTASYDLARGYLGRSVPAGAWDRQRELEGLFDREGRLVALYTRNGYGRAMEIDPNEPAGYAPPPGLTPRESREGALRMGVNVAVHALRSGGRPMPEGQAREHLDPAVRYRYRGDAIEPVAGVFAPGRWSEMRGSAPVTATAATEKLTVEFVPSEIAWAGVESAAPPALAGARAVVLDIELRGGSAARMALRLRTEGGALYESVPLYVRPGANESLRVPLDGPEFRSSLTGWKEYDSMLDRSSSPATVGIVFLGRDLAGSATVARLRLEGW